jgi:DNA-binding LacI/PurR family transcriptional regulator
MEKRISATLTDVAQRAGVSRATVSSVLNGSRSNTRVSEVTRARIMDAVRELDYHPSAIALSLRRRKTDILGFYSSFKIQIRDTFHREILTGLQDGCEASGYHLLLQGALRVAPIERAYGELASGRIDGLALLTFASDPLTERLRGSHLPVVCLANAVPGLPSLVLDEELGGRLIAQHLYERGHRHVQYRIRYDDPLPELRAYSSAIRREQGFLTAAQERGLRVSVRETAQDERRFDDEDIQTLLLAPPADRPTALVCWTDDAALDALAECTRLGLRVPEDIAIVGFNGIEPTHAPIRRLTTIRAPWRELAERAIRMLSTGESPPEEVVFPVTLIEGDTT